MFVAESRRGRRLVGRLDRGSEVIAGLVDVCKKHGVRAAEIRAQGALEQATVAEYDQRNRTPRAPRKLDAPLEILHLLGSAAEEDGKLVVQARVALSRESDNGIELVGGQLVSGRAHSLEFVIDVFDDLILRRDTDPSTGARAWASAATLEAPVPSTSQTPPPFESPARLVAEDHVADAPTWKDVVTASAEPVTIVGDPDVRIVAGDYLDHPKFGRCQVERVEGDYEFVSARMRNQRVIRLSLDVLSLVAVGTEGGHRVFKPERG